MCADAHNLLENYDNSADVEFYLGSAQQEMILSHHDKPDEHTLT